MLFLDLDDFKTVNDDLGHAAGDELLAAVAERIRATLGSTDLAARFGGDEFGILLTGVDEASYAVDAADRLLAGLESPIRVAGESVTAGASIGIAFDTPGTTGVDDLLGQADIAMYRAKAQGKGRHHVFGPDDLADAAAAPGRTPIAGLESRRGLPFRRPAVRHPAFGSDPG